VTTKRGTAVIVEAVAEPTAETKNVDPRRLVLINGKPHLLDIRFRMLTNPELARAMGFADNESTYEFVGNIGEVTKQIGNAVPVNMAAALVKVILGGLE
jgi:DNA (cytosine-5)-methyltransferase 1